MTTSFCANALGALPSMAPSVSASAVSIARLLCMGVLLSSRTSVREGPDAEIVADVSPQAIETFRLDDQEEDDERAEQDQPHIGHEVVHGRRAEERLAERFHRIPDHDRQQRHEGGAEDGSEHGA